MAGVTPEQFIDRYERALGSQRWGEVEPLVHEDVCVTFSTGAVQGEGGGAGGV